MISYAQNREDVLLNRFFHGDSPQVYVDVGAGHPIFHSVTKHFYDIGWNGLNVEPRRSLFEKLCVSRPRDINKNCAVTDIAGEMVFFEIRVAADTSEDNGGLSTLDKHLADNYKSLGYIVEEHVLQVSMLSQHLADAGIRNIGFLKIDVEGFEMNVIRSIDWLRWRPRVVVIECTKPTTGDVCDELARSFLRQKNYLDVFFDGLNRYYVRQEDTDRAGRLLVPANVLDAFVTHESVQLEDENQRLRDLQEQTNGAFFDEMKQLLSQNQKLTEHCAAISTQLSIHRASSQRRTIRGRWQQATQKVQNYFYRNFDSHRKTA